MPQNSNFRLPRDHRFFPKNGSYGYGDKSRWGPPGSILTPMGSQWVKKMVQKRKKITMPQNSNFRLPCDHRFFLKMEVTVMATNHGGDPVESLLGPMGSHWVQKIGQNRTKLPCPKIQIFDYPAIIDFSPKMEVTVVAPNHGGDSLGSSMGPMGPIGSKK